MKLPNKSTILIIAPHPDDEVLGLGGAMKKFSDLGHDVIVLLVSGHLPPLNAEDVFVEHKKQALSAHKILGVKESIFLEIPATYVRDESVAELCAPDHTERVLSLERSAREGRSRDL